MPFTISENAIRTIIHHYTKEAGVRSLEREIASICRKVARKVVDEGKEKAIEVVGKDVPKYLGVPEVPASARRRSTTRSASTNGLSVTSNGGGELLDVRGRGRRRQGQARHHRPAREGHGGERAGGDELRALARRARSGSSRISTRRSTCTFTSPSSSARTGRAPA